MQANTNTIQFTSGTATTTSICSIGGNEVVAFKAPPAQPGFATMYWPHALLIAVWLVICLVWRNTGRVNTADRWYEEDGQVNSQDVRDL